MKFLADKGVNVLIRYPNEHINDPIRAAEG